MAEPVVLQSAVRLPTPPPLDVVAASSGGKRKRSPPSRSPSPRRRRTPPRNQGRAKDEEDGDGDRGRPRRQEYPQISRPRVTEKVAVKPPTEEQKQAAAKAEYDKLINMRSGGTYIPPARLRALQAQITDKTSKEYQRMSWEALKKSINGLINKVNVSNIKHIVPELFGENLVRGRGLFCRSIMKAQAASLPFTPIYAAMVAIVNTKLPQVGELLLHRLITQFKKAFRRNDKAVCLSSTTFLAHLVNQQVVHETLAAQVLLLLLHKPTDDSVEIAVGLTREVGQHLQEMNRQIADLVFNQFRSILHEQDLDKRVQYMIEVLFQVRKDNYKDNPAVKDELDLVEEEDQITHQVSLEDDLNVQDGLNVFKFNAEYEKDEDAYKKLKAEILGEVSGSDDDGEDDDSDESTDDEEAQEEKKLEIKDQTNTDLVNLRRTIYLTIMSSIDFEECCHKLMKINLPVGKESELPSMIIECCSQERTYSKFYGLIGERFAKLNRLWMALFEDSFKQYYETIHRYETNRLRNIARFFGHMISSNGIGWHVLSDIHLNEDETTSSSRIFIKILFQDLVEALGLPKLKVQLNDEILRPKLDGIFPAENPKNIRFSINYFTSIGMGPLTEGMREQLTTLVKAAQQATPLPAPKDDPESDSESRSSYSSYTSSSRSYSRSRTPSRTRGRGRSPTRSVSRSPPRRISDKLRNTSSPSPSRSPPSRRQKDTPPRTTRDRAISRSPPRQAPPRRSRSLSSTSSYDRRDTRKNTRRGRSPSYSSRSDSRSPTPPPRKQRPRSNSRSASPPSRRSNNNKRRGNSMSRSRSRSRSPTPPRRDRNGRDNHNNRARSPLPYRGGKGPARGRNRDSRSPSPAGKGRKRDPSEDSRDGGVRIKGERSPPPKSKKERSPPAKERGERRRAADYL